MATIWKYTQTKKINNFKDLDSELERAELHQKFLSEIIDNDKLLMKKALSLPNLLHNGVMAFSKEKSNESNSDTNLIYLIAQWLIKAIS